jgi:esterase
MNNALHSLSSGEGPPVILLHGLFGQGSNLRGVARALELNFTVHCLDLPDHGRSPWLKHASLSSYAECVEDWMVTHDIEAAHMLGLSLGGKVAMEVALSRPGRVKKLVVADVAPVEYPGNHDRIIDTLLRVAARPCSSRGEAQSILEESIDEPGVVGYLMMGLARVGDTYQWRFNVEGLQTAYPALRAAPRPGAIYEGGSLFLRGADSNYVLPAYEAEIGRRFPSSQMVTILDAGHWVHIDQAETFQRCVLEFLS